MIDSKNIENLKNGTITSLESYICNLIDRNFRTIGNKLLEHKFLLRLNSMTESYVNIDFSRKGAGPAVMLASAVFCFIKKK